MVEELISLSFAFRNLQHSLAEPFGICTLVIYLTHHTEKQLVQFLKALVLLDLGLIRNLDLLNSKLTLHYTIKSVELY
jgi:hypothetical protein